MHGVQQLLQEDKSFCRIDVLPNKYKSFLQRNKNGEKGYDQELHLFAA